MADDVKDAEAVEVGEDVLDREGLADPVSVGVVVPDRDADPELVDDFDAVCV